MLIKASGIRVVIVGTEPGSGRGGISTAMTMFNSCLKKSGIESEYLVVHSPNDNKFGNIVTFLKALMVIFKIKMLSSKNIPYLYLHVGPKGSLVRKLVIALIGRCLGLKVVSHYHSPEFEGYLKSFCVMGCFLRALFKISSRNLVLTKWWSDEFSSKGLHGVEIIPNCLDEAGLVVWGGEAKGLRIFSMGRLVSEKNFSVVIESLKYLPTDTRLYIGGDGPYRGELEEYTKKLNLDESVVFLGWLNNDMKYSQLEKANVFALPSEYDSFGMVFIESLSVGCPVVIGPNPAVVSALDGLEGAFVADDFKGAGLASAILRAVKACSERERLRESVFAKYGVSVISKKLEEVFLSA